MQHPGRNFPNCLCVLAASGYIGQNKKQQPGLDIASPVQAVYDPEGHLPVCTMLYDGNSQLEGVKAASAVKR